jgi:hypothetical protein
MSDVEKALRKMYLVLRDMRDLLAEIRDGQIPGDQADEPKQATPPPDKPRAVR